MILLLRDWRPAQSLPVPDARRARTHRLRLPLPLAFLGALALCAAAWTPVAADPPKVRRIVFKGAEQISPSALRGAMRLQQRSIWKPFQKNYFYGTDHLEPDLARIFAHYRGEGFVFARIDEAIVRHLSRDWVEIEIHVNEGRRAYISGAVVQGVCGAIKDRLDEEVRITPGEPLMERKLREDEERLLAICRDKGYALGEVTRELRFRADSAAVFYIVELGPLVHVGEIHVEGFDRTHEAVIRRELAFEEGQVFRLSRAITTQERLFDLGLFQSVRIRPSYSDSTRVLGDGGDVDVDLTVVVAEKAPGWYGLGFGYTSAERIRLRGEWGYRNLWGRARCLQAMAEVSYQNQQERGREVRRLKDWRAELVYSEPWLLGTFIERNQIRGFYRFEREPILDEYIWGLAFRARWHLSRYRNLIAAIENKWTEEKKWNDARDAIVEERDFQTRFVSLSFSEDRRDFILDPHRGHFRQAAAEYAGGPLGGEASFVRLTVGFSHYVPLSRRFTWAHRARVGYASPVGTGLGGESDVERVPYDDRYFAGGATTVRGYAEKSLGYYVSPNQPQGGLAVMVLNWELRFLLFWKIGGVVFLDAGNVWADYRHIEWSQLYRGWTRSTYSELDMVYALGMGVRLRTPVGPLRLDYGLKMGKSRRPIAFDGEGRPTEYESDGEWHLCLGQAF